MRHLVLLDINRIQEYVVLSGRQKLALIRGASQLLRDVAERHWPDILNTYQGSPVVASGGNFLALLPSAEKAHSFEREALTALVRRTGSARARSARIEFPEGSRFTDVFSSLVDRMAVEKAGGEDPQPVWSGSYWFPCEECGQGPVIGTTPKGDFCRACCLRWEASDGKNLNTDRPEDLSQIGQFSRPENYLAFLHLDFDAMGKFFASAAKGDIERYQRLSEHFERCIQKALRPWKEAKDTEILLSGGDDLAVVLPVQRWIEFLREFQRIFSEVYTETMIDEMPKEPTFSAGVVVAHAKFPIPELFRLSKVLERSAKGLKGTSSVDYEIISGGFSGDPLDFRERAAAVERGGRFRTAKPYSLAALERLSQTAIEMRNEVPSNKMNALYQLAWTTPLQGELDYLYLLSRLSAEQRATVESAVGQQLYEKAASSRMFTYAADVAELWSLT